MNSAAEPTASSTCSGLEAAEANRTSLPTPLRNRSFKVCLSAEKAAAGSLDARQAAAPPAMTKATASAVTIERRRCKPLINLIRNLLSHQQPEWSSAKVQNHRNGIAQPVRRPFPKSYRVII